MKKFSLLFCCLTLLMFTHNAHAGNINVGLNLAPTLLRNSDFNGANTKTNLHFSFGLSLGIPIPCQTRFCQGLFVEPQFQYLWPTRTTFGSTRVEGTGLTGNYSEKLQAFSGAMQIKKHFSLSEKMTAYAGLGFGLSYFKVSDILFTDALGRNQNITVATDSFNFNLATGFGLTYAVAKQFLLDLGVKPHFVFPHVSSQSYLIVPLTLHYAF